MSDLKLTNVKVWKSSTEGSVLLGNGTATFNDVLFVKFTIMRSSRDGNPFVNWPSRKSTKDDKWYADAGFIIDEDLGEEKYAAKNIIENEIIKEFNNVSGISPNAKKANDKLNDEINSLNEESKATTTATVASTGKKKKNVVWA